MPNNKFNRSTHIIRDSESGSYLSSLVMTSSLLRTVAAVSNNIESGSSDNAIAIVGPYGSGKSTSALFLFDLLTGRLEKKYLTELEVLGVTIPSKNHLLTKHYTIVGENASINDSLRKAFKLKKIDTLIPYLEKQISSGERVGIFIDEMGKFLEYASEFPNEGDVYILQQLAELSHRSEGRLLLITIRHQGMLTYLSKLPSQYLNEWKKIQGRFQDLVHVNSTDETLKIIYDRLKNFGIQKTATPKLTLEIFRANPQVSEDTTNAVLYESYGVSPIILLLILAFFKKHAQNERSIFTFFDSEATDSFNSSLSNRSDEQYSVHVFYNYVANNFLHSILESDDAESWSKINATKHLAQSKTFSTDLESLGLALEIIEIVGLLSIYGGDVGLSARSTQIVSMLVDRYTKQTIEFAILELEKQNLITLRQMNDTYNLWHGSTIDVVGRINDKLEEEYDEFDLARELNLYFPREGIVARRAFVETGSFRSAEWVYANQSEIYSAGSAGSDASIICYPLIESGQNSELILQPVDGILFLRQNISASELGFLKEYLACSNLLRNDKEINADRNARDELLTRTSYLGDLINSFLNWNNRKIYNNKNYQYFDGVNWKTMSDGQSVNQMVSESIQVRFPSTPRIHNELVNTDSPSSSAMSGIRIFLNALFTNVNIEKLGIETSGPEYAIYLNVLKETGLHQQADLGWRISSPGNDKSLVLPVWDYLEKEITKWRGENESISFLLLEEQLARPPFGVKRGLAKILIFAKYIQHQHELSLYEEGTFTPDVYKDTLERMLKLPKKFSVVFIPQDQSHTSYLKEIADIFGEKVSGESLLETVSIVIRYFSSLPYYTKHTKSLSQTGRTLISTVLRAKSPESLIYSGIPLALGVTSEGAQLESEKDFSDVIKQLKECHTEIDACYTTLQSKCKEIIANAWAINGTEVDVIREHLTSKVSTSIDDLISDESLRAFYNRVNDQNVETNAWFISFVSFLANRPLEKWHDEHLLIFEAELRKKQYQIEQLYRLKQSSIVDYAEDRNLTSVAHLITEMIENSNVPIDEIDSLLAILNKHYSKLEKIYNE